MTDYFSLYFNLLIICTINRNQWEFLYCKFRQPGINGISSAPLYNYYHQNLDFLSISRHDIIEQYFPR